MQSDGRFPAALSGKIDFGLCSTTITGDRAARIAFTRPYIDTGNAMVVRKDAGIKTIKELNDPKYTYAILNVPPAIARAKQVLPQVKQLLLDSPSALFLAVKTGRGDSRTTLSATLPKNRWAMPVLPWVAMMTESTPSSVTASTMCLAASPILTRACQRTLLPNWLRAISSSALWCHISA